MKPDAALTVGLFTTARQLQNGHAYRPGGRFVRLAKAGLKHDVFLYAFVPEWIDEARRMIRAVPLFLSDRTSPSARRPVVLSALDVVYNRLPTRDDEARALRAIRTLERWTGGALFNPRFFDKWSVYILLKLSGATVFMPHTERCISKGDLIRWAEGAKSAPLQADDPPGLFSFYLKPLASRLGEGIYAVRREKDALWLVDAEGQRARFADAWALADALWPLIQSRAYLLQRAVRRSTLSGRAVDLRALVQKNARGRFRLSGIGARVGAPGAPTTHIARGGTVRALRSALDALFFPAETVQIIERAKAASLAVAERLDARAGGRLGELSLDFAPAEDGALWLLEVNAKPMAFDETRIERRWRAGFFQTVRYFAARAKAHAGLRGGK